MAAEYRDRPAAFPLMAEPEPRPEGFRLQRSHGWRMTERGEAREHADDAFGAVVQHAIVRYLLTDATRAEVAVDLGVTERTAQAYLSGAIWGAYGRPILDRLAELGIGAGRGRWRDAADRPREIVAACLPLLARAADALEGRPLDVDERDRLIADLRLLAAGGSPERVQ